MSQSYFYLNRYGRLGYSPWDRSSSLDRSYSLALPRMCQSEINGRDKKVEFQRHGSKKIEFKREFKFAWPGQTEKPHKDLIPYKIVKTWNDFDKNEKSAQSHYSLKELVDKDLLPKELPICIAYHLAVNHELYYPGKGVQYPVGVLPAQRVQEVVDSVFAIDSHARHALKYMSWLAKGHWGHPLLSSFDTNIRDNLLDISIKTIQLFFLLAYDYKYSSEDKWWERGASYKPAAALMWAGQTGSGLYATHAGYDIYSEKGMQSIPKDIQDQIENLTQQNQNLIQQNQTQYIEDEVEVDSPKS